MQHYYFLHYSTLLISKPGTTINSKFLAGLELRGKSRRNSRGDRQDVALFPAATRKARSKSSQRASELAQTKPP